MKLTKRPDPDGTFALLDGTGTAVAIGLPEQAADARITAEAAIDAADAADAAGAAGAAVRTRDKGSPGRKGGR